ncbi:MAG: 2-amino-4-hydroxy-6-hydroxymethyldihydropteridine diphosphokinase [Magnetococcales bacterium]|nr:2-amino-4-hydroxy-6-hydroxymethyldihydropteridine diphosphokinase [Magnetococcales bacterium]
MEKPVIIAFGANIDPLNNIYRGLSNLHRKIKLVAISTVWRTAPLPDPKHGAKYDLGGSYLNGAVLSHDQIDPFILKSTLRQIEADCHRQRSVNRFAPRPLDLDIVMVGDEVVSQQGMVLPDPDFLSRAFVALPVAQLAPEMIHPTVHKSLAQLASAFLPVTEDMVVDQEATNLLQSIIS